MRPTPAYSIFKKLGSIVAMLSLLWLTISTPFVYRFQQQVKAEKQLALSDEAGAEEDCNPLSNTNEEKAESGVSMAQEYLHELLHIEHPSAAPDNKFAHLTQEPFIAFHPEFIAPPPDAATRS